MLEILPMTEEHIEQVLQVEEACFSIPWTREDFQREMKENKMAIYRIAVLDDKIVGYAGMWHVVTEGHITNVAVLEQYRRESGDNTTAIVVSTASPFKFCDTVLGALGVTELAEGTDIIAQLAKKTGVEAPAPLAGLAGKAKRFDKTVTKDHMVDAVLDMLR